MRVTSLLLLLGLAPGCQHNGPKGSPTGYVERADGSVEYLYEECEQRVNESFSEREADDIESAIATLEAGADECRDSYNLMNNLAELYVVRGDTSRALEIGRDWLTATGDSTVLLNAQRAIEILN